jgi:hypothetical protein
MNWGDVFIETGRELVARFRSSHELGVVSQPTRYRAGNRAARPDETALAAEAALQSCGLDLVATLNGFQRFANADLAQIRVQRLACLVSESHLEVLRIASQFATDHSVRQVIRVPLVEELNHAADRNTRSVNLSCGVDHLDRLRCLEQESLQNELFDGGPWQTNRLAKSLEHVAERLMDGDEGAALKCGCDVEQPIGTDGDHGG